MTRGGKRVNSGRKKINGKYIKILIEDTTLETLKNNIEGKTLSEKIRICIEKGLKND